jgi:hypothetical protein
MSFFQEMSVVDLRLLLKYPPPHRSIQYPPLIGTAPTPLCYCSRRVHRHTQIAGDEVAG